MAPGAGLGGVVSPWLHRAHSPMENYSRNATKGTKHYAIKCCFRTDLRIVLLGMLFLCALVPAAGQEPLATVRVQTRQLGETIPADFVA